MRHAQVLTNKMFQRTNKLPAFLVVTYIIFFFFFPPTPVQRFPVIYKDYSVIKCYQSTLTAQDPENVCLYTKDEATDEKRKFSKRETEEIVMTFLAYFKCPLDF